MKQLIDLLKTHGPQTGKELAEKTSMDVFKLWKICNQSPDINTRTIGERYLRLDKHVEGLARLSPSILREFYNYSIISIEEQHESACLKEKQLRQSIVRISKNKYELAYYIMDKIIEAQQGPEIIRENVCFIIAGDVAYEMSHLEARPEFSTGRLVNGSDLDIVIIHRGLPESTMMKLDASVYDNKYNLLCNPIYKEEVDYVIKDVIKVQNQLLFNTFEAMVASKVLDEGKFLCGSHELFCDVKKMVND